MLNMQHAAHVNLRISWLVSGTGAQPAVGYPSSTPGYTGASQGYTGGAPGYTGAAPGYTGAAPIGNTGSAAYQSTPQAYHEEYQKPQPQVICRLKLLTSQIL